MNGNEPLRDDWQTLRRNDPRSTYQLITDALCATDDDSAWEPVSVLHVRGTREVLDAARQLCESDCQKERQLGADILGQLGVPERAFQDEAVGTLVNMLASEEDEDVLYSIGVALGHQYAVQAVRPLLRLKAHSDAHVRYGLVHGLTGLEDELAIQTLIELSADSSALVRDWATFAIGTQIETDTPAIREALARRLDDPDDETRKEALIGLARRKDSRAVEPILRHLALVPVPEFAVEAAALMEDPR